MDSDKTRLEYYINLIKNDYPKSSVERIRYLKNVQKCYEIIYELSIIDTEYIESLKCGFAKNNELIIGEETYVSLNSVQCQKIKNKFGNKCMICDFEIDSVLEVHHIIPKRLCGKNHESNLIVLCPTCHAIFHKIENKGLILPDVETYLKSHNLYNTVYEYTKHLVEEKKAYQTAFSDNGHMVECQL